MITKIVIQNFQGYKDAEIDFSSGINIIDGANSSGKSTIYRAFDWVRRNRPLGPKRRSWFAKDDEDTRVKICFSEGVAVEKIRTFSGEVYYLLITPDKTIRFEVVGNDVPQQITDIFNIADYNIQPQGQASFLLSESPGKVAARINELVDLDIIDTLFKRIDKSIKESGKAYSRNINAADKKQQEIDSYAYLSQAEEELLSLENEQQGYESSVSDYHSVVDILDKRDEIEEKVSELIEFVSAKKTVKELEELIKKCEDSEAEVSSIAGIIESLKEAEELEKEVASLEQARMIIEEISPLISEYFEITEKNKNISEIIKSNSRISRTIEKSYKELKSLTKEYEEKITLIDTCPLCETPLTISMDKLLSNLRNLT